jgi:hypothetical protein
MLRRHGRGTAGLILWIAVLAGSGCGSGRDVVEVHRRLSLRLEHMPPERADADHDAEIRARVRSSLEHPQLIAWIRLTEADGSEKRIPLEIVASGDAVGQIPARSRGETVRYVIEAKDAAGLVVTLPEKARDGKKYVLRFEGKSSPLLGGTSLLCAWLATFFYLAAGAASIQALRGRLSVGPAGLFAGLGATLVLFGVLLVGGIHAFQITGKPWPSSPLLLAMSRGDLALVTLLWGGNLALGRRALLDEEPDGTRFDERIFAAAGTIAGVLTLIFLIL